MTKLYKGRLLEDCQVTASVILLIATLTKSENEDLLYYLRLGLTCTFILGALFEGLRLL